MKLNLPNLLSLLRIILSVPVYFLITAESKSFILMGVILYFIAALTDYFDGWIARRYNETSREGKFFDPLADKVLTITVMAILVKLQIMPLWMMLVIAGRDILTTVLRIYGSQSENPVKTSLSAKAKTFYQMSLISMILILYSVNLYLHSRELSDFIIHSPAIYSALLLLTLLSFYTFVEYIVKTGIFTKK